MIMILFVNIILQFNVYNVNNIYAIFNSQIKK